MQQNQAYLVIIVLARVVTKLGSLPDVNTKVIEGLFASDLSYLQTLYERLNGETAAEEDSAFAGAGNGQADRILRRWKVADRRSASRIGCSTSPGSIRPAGARRSCRKCDRAADPRAGLSSASRSRRSGHPNGLDRLAARPDAPVLVVEGEKAADAAAQLLPEYVVMTWQGGSNAVAKAFWPSLVGRKVTIWPDADEAGHTAAKAVSATLKDIAASVRIIDLPADLPKSWDLADPSPEGGLDLMGMLSRAREQEPEWKSELRIIRPTEWQGRPAPERRWRVKNWLLEAIVAALYGDGGVGKSLLLQQLLTSCAIGVPWFGLETKPCKAIGFFCEDSGEELWRRQGAINKMYGCDMKDLGSLQLVSREYMENILIDFTKDGIGESTALHGHLMSWAKDFGAELIGVDTAADTFGGSEIVRVQVRQFIQKCLGALVRETGGTVVLAAHPSVAGMRAGTGGSTGWNNSVRARLHLKRTETESGVEPDRDARILELPKSNYGPDGTQLRLRWVAGTLRPESNGSASATGGNLGNTTKRAEMVFLKLLAEFAEAGIYVGNSKQGKYAPREMAASPNCGGFRVQDLERAMRGLVAKKRIKLEKKGRGMAFVTCDPGEAAQENPYDFNEEAA